jgi:hypothetical protein
VIGATVLWEIRDQQPEQLAALATVCRGNPHYGRLVEAIDGWKKRTPLEALQELDREQRADPALKEALAALLGYFVDDLLAEKALGPSIHVEGSVSGCNIVIGGQQVVWGDLIINQNVFTGPPLPENPREFGGRQTEFDALASRLKAGQTSAIQRLGGIGKTTLAKKLAYHLHQTGAFRTVVWTEVNQKPNPRALLTAWAKYDESHYQDDITQPLASLISAAKERLKNAIDTCPTCDTPQALIILDDIWPGVDLLMDDIPEEL